MSSPHESLVDLLSSGDEATVRPRIRRAYALRRVAGDWVIGVNTRSSGRAGSGIRSVEDEGADIENQAYLESLGWGR